MEIVPQEIIQNKIFLIRGKKVMLDKDLAMLYEVETKILNKSVTKNFDRFPADFCFQLTKEEFRSLMFHFGTSKRGGTRKLPRAFTKRRELVVEHRDLREKIESLEKKIRLSIQSRFRRNQETARPARKAQTTHRFSFKIKFPGKK